TTPRTAPRDPAWRRPRRLPRRGADRGGEAGGMASFSAIGGVLAQRNARIFYSGSVVCWTGSWVQRIATDWLAWQMTHSTLWVGVIAFCNLVPSVVVSPIAGAG